ncbi:MAG TPA: chromosome partitioning protein ParB, partial [Bacillota bacterium]|nr:chromosome partitioning protein ParB [Bacillota bacterium]
AALGTKVTIHHKKNKGSIEIEYYSDEEFDRIFDLLEK